METLFNQFMHIYFWVYLSSILVNALTIQAMSDEQKDKAIKGITFLSIIGLTLWIMSFKY